MRSKATKTTKKATAMKKATAAKKAAARPSAAAQKASRKTAARIRTEQEIHESGDDQPKGKKASKAVTQKPHIERDKKTGEDLFVLGKLRLPIDGRDLARTVGGAQYGYGKGIVDQWSDSIWKTLLESLQLPAEPIVREIAQWPVKRLVQRVWLEHFEPERLADEKGTAYAKRDEERRAEYLAKFEDAKTVSVARAERAVKNLAGKGFAKQNHTYKPTDELKKQKFGGQAALILAFFKKTKFAPATCSTIAEGINAELETKQPAEKVVAHYMNAWRSKGLLEVL